MTKLELALAFDEVVTALEETVHSGEYNEKAYTARNYATEALNSYLGTLSADDSRLYLMRNITAQEPLPEDWVSDLFPEGVGGMPLAQNPRQPPGKPQE